MDDDDILDEPEPWFNPARAPNNDELTIHEEIFGGCAHRSWAIVQRARKERDWDGVLVKKVTEYIVCNRCGEERIFRFHGEKAPPAPPEDMLRLGIPRYSREVLYVPVIRRMLEELGCRVIFTHRGEGYRRTISREQGSVTTGETFDSEGGALCRAVSMLAAQKLLD